MRLPHDGVQQIKSGSGHCPPPPICHASLPCPLAVTGGWDKAGKQEKVQHIRKDVSLILRTVKVVMVIVSFIPLILLSGT